MPSQIQSEVNPDSTSVRCFGSQSYAGICILPTKVKRPKQEHSVFVFNNDDLDDVENLFDAAIDNVRDAADLLLNKLKSLHDAPDAIEVTFGLKATGELGGNFFVAKAGLEANYTITLKWERNGGN